MSSDKKTTFLSAHLKLFLLTGKMNSVTTISTINFLLLFVKAGGSGFVGLLEQH